MFSPVDLNQGIRTKQDLQRVFIQLTSPLLPFFSQGRARLLLGNTSYEYTDQGAGLEGFSRLLWGLAPYAAGGGTSCALLDIAKEGLKNGTDPSHPDYWGVPGDFDQRLVEMAAVSFSILCCKDHFWDGYDDCQKKRLADWLNIINRVKVVENNWHFFRVLVNLALDKAGVLHSLEKQNESLETIESLYQGNGWYQDGDGGGLDYYNAWAFHFYSMIYYREKKIHDPARCERFRERAEAFAKQFQCWFDSRGAGVPFGRSLTYRFAQASLFSALAWAGIEAVPWAECRRMVFQNLRYWLSQPVFERDGVLSVGYGYPNQIMSEEYNAPGSPYWCMKLFLVLALPDDHPFWMAKEAENIGCPALHLEKEPGFLVQRVQNGRQVVFLSGRQYKASGSGYCLSNFTDKYTKFAYSSLYGFSVGRGTGDLRQGAFDSVLALSDGGPYRVCTRRTLLRASEEALLFRWYPWEDVKIDTALIPAGDWHIRIHRIKTGRRLAIAEGGFCCPRPDDKEGTCLTEENNLAKINTPEAFSTIEGLIGFREGVVIRPEAFTSLTHRKTFLPMLKGTAEPGETVLACRVTAGERMPEKDKPDANPPELAVRKNTAEVTWNKKQWSIHLKT